MSKIKSLTLENFGPFQGKHKFIFRVVGDHNLTVVLGSSHYGLGPPTHFGGTSHDVLGDNQRFELTSMVSYGIRHALGQTATKDLYGMENFKDWSKIFPEHYYKDAKATIEIEGETPVINEENEILYFFSAKHSKHRQLTVPGEKYVGGKVSIVSSPDIPKKFLTQKVVDEMNKLCKKYKCVSAPEGEQMIGLLGVLLSAKNNYKFVLHDGQIQFHTDKGKAVKFGIGNSKYDLYITNLIAEWKTNWFDLVSFVLFIALRKVHLKEDSFAVIQGGWNHFKREELRGWFNAVLANCPQVIFLDDYPVWFEEPGYYTPGVGDLEQAQAALSRVYEIKHTGEDEEILASLEVLGVEYPIYLDSHATTPVDPKVFDAMKPYFTENFGNASSLDHSYGYDASVAVQTARETIAKAIGASMDEIIFTSGATESDNLALIGVMEKNKEKGNHLITCVTEHKAILDTAKHLEKNGCDVTYLPVDEYGQINLDELKNAITDKTVLISIMAANNEIGTIADLEAIGKIAHENDVLFHTDAAQAVGHIPIDVQKMNIDLMSFSSHKIYGPKGIGALYIRSLSPRVN